MHQQDSKLLMFRNRLAKVYKHLSRQAARQGISCFRIYDHDLPEAPFIIEKYNDSLYVSEYKRQHHLSDEEHESWLQGCKVIMADVTGVPQEAIFIRLRKRKESRLDQYQKLEGEKAEMVVQEGGLNFLVNLSDYLDTGLFLDHRITRGMVREESKGKRVLNLFCYTGSFSVYAAAGGADLIVSVDLSKTYLQWAEQNMQLNLKDFKNASFVHADVLQYLKTLSPQSFDLIVLDPPTFSNSKRMKEILDVQRDHVELIGDCMRLLSPGGILYFSTNFTRFNLDAASIKASEIKDITKSTTPFDFAQKLKRPCFKIVK